MKTLNDLNKKKRHERRPGTTLDLMMTSDNDEEDVQDILFSYNEDEKNGSLWSSLFQIEIILPLCTVLFTNSEFQLYVARFGDWFNICSISN